MASQVIHLGLRLLLAFSSISLAACGTKVRPGKASQEAALVPTSLTGGEDSDGRPYTNFDGSAPSEDATGDTPVSGSDSDSHQTSPTAPVTDNGELHPALDLRALVASYSAVSHSQVQLDLDLRFPNDTVSARAVLALDKVGEPQKLQVQNSNAGIEYAVQCKNSDCRNFELSASKDNNTLLKARYLEEQRSVKLTSPGEIPSDLAEVVTPEGQRDVRIKALAISGSKSSIAIQSVSKASLGDFKIEGDLVSTEGDCTPMKLSSNLPDASAYSVCLMGNSHFGDIVLQVRRGLSSTARTFLATLPRLGSIPFLSENHDDQCLAQSTASIHPYLGALKKDCGHSVIKQYIKTLWLNKNNSKKQNLAGFIDLNAKRLTGSTDKQAENLNTMLRVLRENGMPEISSIISLVESGFKPSARSPVGAGGWWQIMPKTATHELGLRLAPVDERNDLVKSTRAASTYLRGFLEHKDTKNDLRLALTSYNCGLGNLQKGSRNARRTLSSPSGHRFGRLTLDEIMAYSKDFWVLRELNMIPRETADYVPRIMSAMVLAANPEQGNYNYRGRFKLQ